MTFYDPDAATGDHFLSEEESIHCVRVLRQRNGDRIRIMDGKGTFFDAVIEEAHPKKCKYSVEEIHRKAPDPYSLHLAIAPTKNIDRMEWMIEKCVEIGLHQITFLQCGNSERTRLRYDRLEKKAIAAMKQSGRAYATKINSLTPFPDFISNPGNGLIKHIAYVPASLDSPHLKETKPNSDYIVLIGPEGDFSPEEIQQAQDKGYTPTSLGNSRLRTETAGLVACHTLALLHS